MTFALLLMTFPSRGPVVLLNSKARPCRRSRIDFLLASTASSVQSSGLIDDWISQNGETFNLDFDDVAGLHPERRLALCANASWYSADDDVAGL